jgi:stage V sporulation protein AD
MYQSWIPLSAYVESSATAVGKKEFEGPLGHLFDLHDPDDRFGKKTWESAESEMQRMAFNLALSKSGRADREVDVLFAGDLLNQCVGSAYGLLSFRVPYIGLYGACSTCAESLFLASMGVSYGAFSVAAACTSSHYCSAERQFRAPLEYGSQRPPTAQWTVTGAGAFILTREDNGDRVRISAGMPGIAGDFGINDANNMGAAMAPAAADTLERFLRSTNTKPSDYDLIVTGDLGFEGGDILLDLLRAKGIDISTRYTDCGRLIYDRAEQDPHGGGSGCGCSAVVLSSHFLPKLKAGEIGRMIFLATGAMMSPDSVKQGENIPAVAHLIVLESPYEKSLFSKKTVKGEENHG